MKQLYKTIKIYLIISVLFLSQTAISQCQISDIGNGSDVESSAGASFLWGQGFTSECDGDLEYVQFVSNETGTVSAGTLNVYSGNSVSGTPIYSQSHPSITINNIGDPIRINITNTLALTQNNQYTFEFTVDNAMNVLADFSGGYTGGSAFQDGVEFATINFIFEVSISNSTLSLDDFVENKNIQLFPNPSSDFIIISNLEKIETFSILNTLGQEVVKGKIINDEKIDISNFKNGLYFLRFENGNTLKFIKE
ncbi:T9SS type A sorting domain-containing protein [Olleya sp. UBA1516]|uniref:T9SS type A sorting domain-containing protein n=1 Tax=Olleya sp. UBA1516 TaxID=1947013 RepID=UPI0025CE894A|nr:T9SS type A sorting domain-containing protein [Olleya sp. UBA1516]|tara:strand:- start:4079 stop:4834 length:756 start_codon:yes stop_codon:yes gene_type:complete